MEIYLVHADSDVASQDWQRNRGDMFSVHSDLPLPGERVIYKKINQTLKTYRVIKREWYIEEERMCNSTEYSQKVEIHVEEEEQTL